jgi:hypothetical protein
MTVGIVIEIALASILKGGKICQKFKKRKFIEYVTSKRRLSILLNQNPFIKLYCMLVKLLQISMQINVK